MPALDSQPSYLLGKEAHWGEPNLKNKIEVDEVELVLPIQNKVDGDTR